jgi:WS/DGAT/MGAT family acyltransferase
MRRLHAADALFLYNETPTQHMHTLKIAILDPSGIPGGYSFEQEKAKLASRLHRVPPFRWRIVPTPLRLHHPLFAESEVDIDYHVRRAAVPAPGGPRELSDLISEIASRPLDRGRPLWEIWLVEGLEGGKIASICKIHHTLADGVASAELVERFLTHEREDEVPHDAPAWTPEPTPSRARRLGMALYELAGFLPHAVRALAHGIRESRRRESAEHAAHAQLLPPSSGAPLTPLNRVLSAQRRFAYVSLPLADAKTVRRVFGVTLNDVVLTVLTTAVRGYLVRRGELPRVPMVATVPVSLRTPEEVGRFGNHTSAMYVLLRSDIEDPVERLQATHAAAQAAKQHFQDTLGAQLADWMELFPPLVAGMIFSRVPTWLAKLHRPPVANLIVSNVPGPSETLYYGQARLTSFLSVGPVLEGMGLNATVWSYGDQLNVSFLACRDSVPGVWELADGARAALEELVKAAAQRGAPAAAPAEAAS